MRTTRIAGFVFVALLATASCTGTDDATSASATTQAADVEVTPSASAVTTMPPAASSPSSEVSTSSSEVVTQTSGPSSRDFSAIAPIVETFVRERGLNGAGLVVVDRDDGVVYHEHWGEFDESRISLIASSSKMITAGVLLRLDDEGLLDVDAPVEEVVAWGAGNPDITPAQLVSNSSGLVGLGPNPVYAPYVCQFLPDGTLQECAEQIFTTVDDDADIVAPDSEFRYGGAQWQVAGAVAELASGKTWAELIDEIYVRPCGLEHLGYNNHFTQIGAVGFEYPDGFDGDLSQLAETDNPNMEGGAYSTTGDYAQLLLMHLRGGRCGDEQVLSGAALDRLHADRIDQAYEGSAGPGTGYGMGWWVDRETGRRSDAGAYGSVPWLDLEDGYGAYLVIEDDAGTGNQLAGLLYDPIETAMTAPE